jgi:hypothetical protein
VALPLKTVPDFSGFGVDGRSGLEGAQQRRGALVDQAHVARGQLDRADSVRLIDSLSPPGSLGDRERRVVAGEGLIDDEAQDRGLWSHGAEDRRSGDACLDGDVLDGGRQVALVGEQSVGGGADQRWCVPASDRGAVGTSLDISHPANHTPNLLY